MRICIIFILLVGEICVAQPYEPNRAGFGASVSYGIASNTANFTQLPGVPNCCPKFDKGRSSGFLINGFYDFKIFNNFYAGFSLGYNYFEAKFSKSEETWVMYHEEIVKGAFKHNISLYMNNLVFQPFISFNFFKSFRIGFGPYTSWVFAKNYWQEEEITEPLNAGTFLNKDGTDSESRIRNVNSGKFPAGTDLYVGADLFLSWEMPLNRDNTLRLNPSFNFGYHFNIDKALNWDALSYRVALGFRYDLTPAAIPAIDTMQPDSTRIIDSLITIKTDSAIVLSMTPDTVKTVPVRDSIPVFKYDTTEITDTRIVTDTITRIDTFDITNSSVNDKYKLTHQLYSLNNAPLTPGSPLHLIEAETTIPLLYRVYFDRDKTSLPERYKGKLSNSMEYSFYSLYYKLLKTTCERMEQMEDEKLILTGYDTENLKLAAKRAESVKKYLVKKFNAKKNRIEVRAELTGKNDEPYECYRVEISSEHYRVQYPYWNTTPGFILSAPLIEFRIEKDTDGAAIKDWIIQFRNNNDLLFEGRYSKAKGFSSWFNTTGIVIPRDKKVNSLLSTCKIWDRAGKLSTMTNVSLNSSNKSHPDIFRIFRDFGDTSVPAYDNVINDFKSINTIIPTSGNSKDKEELSEKVRNVLHRSYPGKKVSVFFRDNSPLANPAYPETYYYYRLIELQFIK